MIINRLFLNLCFAAWTRKEEKKPAYNKKKGSDPRNAAKIVEIFNSFREPAWEVSKDEHSSLLAGHLFEGLCNAFPVETAKSAPRALYIAGHLWAT